MTNEIIITLILMLLPLIYCLFFLYKIIKSFFNIFHYFKCRKKYKNIIQSHLNMCKQCEEKLRQDKYTEYVENYKAATTLCLIIIGFVLLIKCSDIFIDAISSIATNFKMSKMMSALTVAAFGTCAPELAISFNSISSGSGDIALANVLGSNVVNILLVRKFVVPLHC